MANKKQYLTQDQFNITILDQLGNISRFIESFDTRLGNCEGRIDAAPRQNKEGNFGPYRPRGFSDDLAAGGRPQSTGYQYDPTTDPNATHANYARSEYFDDEELMRDQQPDQANRNPPPLHGDSPPARDPNTASARNGIPPGPPITTPQGRQYPYRSSNSQRSSNLFHYLEGDLCPPTRGPAEALQEEFVTIRDSVTTIRLPPGVKFIDSRQGLKRESQGTYNIVVKCAKYAETSLKILSQLHTNDPVVRDLIIIQAAQIKYLVEEQAALLVQGNFNESTSKIYRTLQRNTSAFADEESIKLLRSAAQLAAAATDRNDSRSFRGGGRGSQFQPRGRGGFRGNYRGNRGRGNQPNYSSWHNQQLDTTGFPPRRQQQATTQDNAS